MFGFSEGAHHGKGGSMHFYNKETNYYGGAGIVGAQVPVGAGLAFEAKYNHKGEGLMPVGVSMYGDGAANQGQIWEAANMSKLWGLPSVFVCENNQYGMGTSIARSSANTSYYKQGGVIIPGILADGNDYLAVRECFRFIKEYCGQGKPIFCELNTYRYHGHSMSDPGKSYRPGDEVPKMRESRDPIERIKHYMVEAGFADEAQLKAEEKKIRDEVSKATKEALKGTPPLGELYTDILSDGKGGSEIPEFIRMPLYADSVGEKL